MRLRFGWTRAACARDSDQLPARLNPSAFAFPVWLQASALLDRESS